jgi:hypothetical protein
VGSIIVAVKPVLFADYLDMSNHQEYRKREKEREGEKNN